MEYDLVFEGGGAKGMVFVGAMDEFYKRGHTHGRLMGTSAGAITAALTAAGYTTEEMMAALAEKDAEGKPVFASFMAPPGDFPESLINNGAFSHLLKSFDLPFVPDFIEEPIENFVLKFFAEKKPANSVFSLVELGGWYSADNFLTWLRQKMDEGTFNGQPRRFSNLTMQQFFDVTGKDLTLIGADTSGEIMLAINHRTAPDCPVVWAVRMSMSIPMLWQEVIWQEEWGTYRGKDISGHSIVDGGLLSNFPIELFISKSKIIVDLMGDKNHDNVMGLLIDEKMPVPGTEVTTEAATGGIQISELQTVKRLGRLVSTVMGAHDKAVISAFEDLVVRLPAKGYGTVEFDMSDERRNLLVDAGRNTMKQYLDRLEGLSVSAEAAEPITPEQMADQMAARMLQE
jgi:NTE family protein